MPNRYRTVASLALSFAAAVLICTPVLAESLGPGRLADQKGFNAARTSIVIAEAASGRDIASHLPDLKLNPASCMKIVTSAAALSLLGPDWRFRTYLLADRELRDGTIDTLYVKGTGDPRLVNEELAGIAGHLYSKGLRKIANGIVIDNSYFDSYEYPRKSGFDERAYTAKTSATAVNFNSIAVEIGPGTRPGAQGRVSLDPPLDYFRVVNKLVTGGKFRLGIWVKPDGESESILVSGRIPPRTLPEKFYRSVADPAVYTASTIAYFLRQAGIVVGGTMRAGEVPAKAVRVFVYESPPLADLIKDMNKISNNFMAEQLIKHIGAVKFGPPGTTASGIMAAEEYLAKIGIPRGSYIIENASGLSDVSRISASQLVSVLVAAYKEPAQRNALLNSLSILGIDGTTKNWRIPQDLEGRAYVKTGTLNNVSTLAGYAPMASGRMAAFAILANGLPQGMAGAHQAQIGVVKAIMEVEQ